MRSAVLLLCGTVLVSLAHAADRFVCTPSPDGARWQCSGAGDVSTATVDATASRYAAGPNAGTRSRAASRLDWVARAELSPDRLRTLPEYCDGAYVEPTYPVPLGTDPATLPLRANTRDLQYWLNDRAELSGSVEVARGNQSVIASRASYSEADQVVTVVDGVTVREPGLLVEGRTAQYEVATGAAVISDSQFVLQQKELRGTAETLQRNEDGDVTVTRGSFTRCEPGNSEWRLTARTVQIDSGAQFGTAKHAVLRVHEVPVFYTPYLRFPVTDARITGWLFPDISLGQDNGLDIAVPYYLNLAPNYDATLVPRYIQDRGNELGGEVRHLSEYGRLEVGGAYLPRDQEFNGKYSKTDFDNLGIPGPFDPADRWLYEVRQHGRIGNFHTFVDATKVSDFDYFRDLGGGLGSSSKVDTQQYASVDYSVGGLTTRLWAQDFQRLDVTTPEPYRRLPEFDLNYRSPMFGPLAWSVDSAWASFTRPNEQFVGIGRITGDRLYVEPRVMLPLDWAPGFVHVVGGYRYAKYNLDDVPVGADENPDRKIGFGSLDTGLFFERDTNLFGSATIQTLEPRLYYLYQQYRNQEELPEFDVSQLTLTFDQLFRDNRFAGYDRIGDANQLTVALTTRWIDGDTGQELIRASLGQIRYFEDRQVTLNGVPTSSDEQTGSALAGQFGVALGASFSLRSAVTWDPNDGDLDELGAILQYHRDSRHLFNLSYRRVDQNVYPPIKQPEASLYWSVLRHWSLIARFAYDLEGHRTIGALGGLEYSDCCWQLRVVGRKFLSTPGESLTPNAQSDEGVFFQVIFKGLAGFGGRIDSDMQTAIPGYVAEDF